MSERTLNYKNNAVAALEAFKTEDSATDLLSEAIPYKLGKYEIKTELGRGSCGIVYKGFDPFVCRDVAIKVSLNDPSLSNTTDNLEKLDFFTEAHAAGKLQHPNIVSLYDAHIEKGLNYIVMEHIEGETLYEYCKPDSKPLPLEKILECVFKCCQALDFSHKIGVIHCDIKPSNIMLNKEGETKLMDFSVAKIIHNNNPSEQEFIVGSPSYMSPEQISNDEIGPSSDLYSLAAVTFHLITGHTLFSCDDMKQTFHEVLHKPAPRLADIKPDLPEALSDILEKALRKNPDERYESGKAMAADIIAVFNDVKHADNNINWSNKINSLKKLDFFREFNHEHIEEILNVSSLLRFAPNDIISQEGDIDNSYYIILQGNTKIEKFGRTLTTLHQGDCLGGASKNSNKRTATITASGHSVIIKINTARIETMSLEAQLSYYKAFSENLINRLSFD